MNKLENILNKFITPVATKMNKSRVFSTMSEAFIRLSPITLGVAFLMIIGNFPIPGWTEYLANVGMKAHFDAAVGATMNALSIFVAFNVAYTYIGKGKYKPLSAGLLSIASFLLLMPQSVVSPTLEKAVTDFPGEAVVTGMQNTEAFQTSFTGGSGLLVAILVGFLTSFMYEQLHKRNVTIKLPESVPSNVSDSLSPSILSGIIITVFFIIRVLFSFTPFENAFAFIGQVIQIPLQGAVSAPGSIIFIGVFTNMLWFFGIHPSLVNGVTVPILLASNLANIEAYTAGKPQPFLLTMIVASTAFSMFGGQGSTYGLIVSMIRAKSERYRQLFKLAVVPSIFNINEPLVFGMPIMMNPIFFLPMLLCPILMGGAAWILTLVLKITNYNPLIQLPWTTPAPIVMALRGGVKLTIIFVVLFLISVIVWYPFFKIADKKALEEEQGLEI